MFIEIFPIMLSSNGSQKKACPSGFDYKHRDYQEIFLVYSQFSNSPNNHLKRELFNPKIAKWKSLTITGNRLNWSQQSELFSFLNMNHFLKKLLKMYSFLCWIYYWKFVFDTSITCLYRCIVETNSANFLNGFAQRATEYLKSFQPKCNKNSAHIFTKQILSTQLYVNIYLNSPLYCLIDISEIDSGSNVLFN